MRVFVAIEISKEGILKKIQTFQKNVGIDAKPTKIDQIHFTLKFLGEIDQVKYEQVKDVMEKISFSSFDILLKGVGEPCPVAPAVPIALLSEWDVEP